MCVRCNAIPRFEASIFHCSLCVNFAVLDRASLHCGKSLTSVFADRIVVVLFESKVFDE